MGCLTPQGPEDPDVKGSSPLTRGPRARKDCICYSKPKCSYWCWKPHLQVQHTFSKSRENCRREAASQAAWKGEASHFPFMKEPGSQGGEHFQTGCAEIAATMQMAGPWIPNPDVNIYNTDRKAPFLSSHCSLSSVSMLDHIHCACVRRHA